MLARLLAAVALAGALAAAACHAAPEPSRDSEHPALGLMTTLPLIWAEAADVGELLQSQGDAGWVRQELERRFTIEPLDTLDAASLAGIDRLVLAQPRPLTPAENVALDAWVRGGGKLLLFADPMLTRHSRFPVGDRRRPQDVVLLSPILAHWGLELMFDEEQGEGDRIAKIEGAAIPINLAGNFRIASARSCTVEGDGLLARCRLGRGQAAIFADAAVLDDPESSGGELRRSALSYLLSAAFD